MKTIIAIMLLVASPTALASDFYASCKAKEPIMFKECVRTKMKSMPGWSCENAQDCKDMCTDLRDSGALVQACVDKAELAAYRARKNRR